MAFTPRGIQKPDGSTPINIYNLLGALADTTDAAINAIDPTPGPVQTAGFTIAAGWSLHTFRFVKAGQVGNIFLRVTRTGGTITVPASGDFANQSLGYLDFGLRPITTSTLSAGGVGRVAAGAAYADGEIQLNAVGGTTNIVNTDTILLGGVVILA